MEKEPTVCRSSFPSWFNTNLAKRYFNYLYLIYYKDQKYFDKEPDLYRKAEISRPVFSKIRSMRKTNHRPSKPTVIKYCLALHLNSKEIQEMLYTVL